MLGHTSVRTTEVYVRSNKSNISEQMDIVEEKLFGQNGRFKSKKLPGEGNEDCPDATGEAIHLPKIIKMY